MRTMMRRRHGPAFTLIELLIVLAILGTVIGTIGACLAAGIRVWEEAQRFNAFERDASIALALFEKDLKNLLPIHALGFEGDAQTVRFPSLLQVEDQPRVGSVEYAFDARAQTLARRELSDTGAGIREERLLGNISEVSLRYFALHAGQTGNEAPRWSAQTPPVTNFPGRVRIDVSLDDEQRGITLTETILLPVR